MMRNEILRQAVHISGVLFIFFGQFFEKSLTGLFFLLIAFLFLIYSEYITKFEKNKKTLFSRIECRLRDVALMLERKDSRKPFAGAFWFYFGIGLAFLLFPLKAASAAGIVLAVSDSISTVLGLKLGRIKIIGRKTLEGTAAFFITAFIVCFLFFNPLIALFGAIVATFSELLPETKIIYSKGKGIIDDNLLIPIITGFALALVIG
ncbi:MAG: hypothetical protein QXN71_00215 [Candidatus Aenigmatarchaeota archaeon]